MPKELAMATTSHQALMRHQNQRSRYSSPVPAPTWRMMSKADLAESSRYTIPLAHTNKPIVVMRPMNT